MDMGLQAHVAVVTGGARGIGAGIVRGLAAEGAHIAIWDRDLEPAQVLADEISAAGGTARAYAGDVTDRGAVERILAQVADDFGPIRVLVNNAGFSRDATVIDMTDEQWDSVYEVCLRAAFLVCRAAAPAMIAAQYGRIVNVASRTHSGEIYKANYSAAKAGLVALTRTIAIELGKNAITANCVAPGLIRTERVIGNPGYDDIDRRARRATPIQRPGETSDVADAVVYLASPRTGFVSGEIIHVTGGRAAS